MRIARSRAIRAALTLLGAGITSVAFVGSDTTRTERRDVANFDEVTLSGSGSLNIEQIGSESLTITAAENILPLLTSEVVGRRLVIGVKPGAHLRRPGPITYALTVKDLHALTLSGSGDAWMVQLTTDRLALTLSGSGFIDLAGLAVPSLRVTLSGSGDATVAGEARDQQIILSGSGSYRAADLTSANASIGISGSGSATLYAGEALDARISGSGNVTYRGTPSNVSTRVSGSGRVTQG